MRRSDGNSPLDGNPTETHRWTQIQLPPHRQNPPLLDRYVLEEEEGRDAGGVVASVELAPAHQLGGALT